jgi:hypothetical protein
MYLLYYIHYSDFGKRGVKYSSSLYIFGNKKQIKLNCNKFTAVSHCSCYFYSVAEIRLTRMLLVYVIVKSTYKREVHIYIYIYHKSTWGVGDTSPTPHIEVRCQPTSLSTLCCALHPLNRRLGAPQNQPGHIREEENIFPLLGIEPRFLGCSGDSLVTVWNVLSWLQR